MASMIINHMNKDHKLSLFDYLEYYGQTRLDPLDSSQDVEMDSIDLDHMMLKISYKKYPSNILKIPIDPPMENLGEARKRLVEMAHISANANGVAVQQITKYVGPSGKQLLLALPLIIAPIVIYGAAVTGVLQDYLPSLASMIGRKPNKFMLIWYGLHTLETIFLMRPRVNKYRVPYGTRYRWYLASFFEGITSIQRFDALIDKKK